MKNIEGYSCETLSNYPK